MENQRSSVGVWKSQELPVSVIRVAKYQKPINSKRVHIIVENFDEHRMRPIDVSYRDGRYWVFDGNHRLNSYLIMGRVSIPCIIHYGLTYEEEAMLFALQQENVGAVTAMHKWNALCEAQEVSTVKIREIALKHGYTIGNGGATNRRILAVKAIQDIVKNLGLEGLDRILDITRTCWNGSKHAMSYDMLGGLQIFMNTHQKDVQYRHDKLVQTLSVIEPCVLLRAASGKDGINGKTRVAKAIEVEYNKKSRGSMRLATKVPFGI